MFGFDLSINGVVRALEEQYEEGIRERQVQLKAAKTAKESNRIAKEIEYWEKNRNGLQERMEHHIALIDKRLVWDSDCRRVDICVLKYKDPEQEQRCVEALVRHTDWPHKISWYDSRNQTANFAKLWNHLVEVSNCDYILIMDSDAYVTDDGWLTRMMSSFEEGFECLESHGKGAVQISPKNPGLVVPVTHKEGAHTIQGKYRDSQKVFLTDAQVSGFFFLFRKKMWEDIGPFDERFYLHGQDSEWVDRVITSNWDIVVRGDVYVDHGVSSSIQKAVEEENLDREFDLIWTNTIYTLIRAAKELGVHRVWRYEK